MIPLINNIRAGLVLSVLTLSSCTVQNFTRTQSFANFSKYPYLVSADNNSGISHHSGKITSLFGLASWGDASINSAIDISGDGTIKLGRVSQIDEERRLLFGCGYYRIDIRGKVR